MTLYLGAPLWAHKPWVGDFLPAGTKPRDLLAQYSRRLNTVEGNTTFYALPDPATVARWRDNTPEGFKFCLKVPQEISHRRRLLGCEADTATFVERLRLLGRRCGPAFLQLPPSFTGRNLDALRAYLSAWPREFSLAVEPRHADFFGGAAEAEFDDILRGHGAARCVFATRALFSAPASHGAEVREAQERKPRFPDREARTGPFAFVRYVCHPEIEANAEWLRPWVDRVGAWLAAGDDVYFFVHHPDDTFAPAVARIFHALVAERADVPPLPDWGPAGPTQPALL